MNISFNISGSIANITEEKKEALKDLLNYNEVILMLRGNDEAVTINITDIVDIGVLETKVHVTRALQIIK